MYDVYLTDYPFKPFRCDARTEEEAFKQGNIYIRLWKLDAEVLRVEKVEEDKSVK